MLSDLTPKYPILAGMGDLDSDRNYDNNKISFGITINNRKTFTGVTDFDRSLTIKELTRFMANIDGMTPEAARVRFGQEFRAPGHVILLNGARGGLTKRQGHTELSLELVRMAGLIQSSTMCEMLDGVTGKARTKASAERFAAQNNLAMLNGGDVIQAFKSHDQIR